MWKAVPLLLAALSLGACDTVVRGTANTVGYAGKTAGYAGKQAVRGTYAVGKGAYRGGRYVVAGPRDEDDAAE